MDSFWSPFDNDTQEDILAKSLSNLATNHVDLAASDRSPGEIGDSLKPCPLPGLIRQPRPRRYSDGLEYELKYSKKLLSALEGNNVGELPKATEELLDQLGYIVRELGVKKCVNYIMWWHSRQENLEPVGPLFYHSPAASMTTGPPSFYAPPPALAQPIMQFSGPPLAFAMPPHTTANAPPTPPPTVLRPPPIPMPSGISMSPSPSSSPPPIDATSSCMGRSSSQTPGTGPRQSRWVAAGLGVPDRTDMATDSKDSGARKGRGPDYVCVFCRNNGESHQVYKSHRLKDVNGCIKCPVLHAYTCPTCGATGDNAHTLKYCPRAKESSRRPFFVFPLNSVCRRKTNNSQAP